MNYGDAAIVACCATVLAYLLWPRKKHVCQFKPTATQNGNAPSGGALTVVLLLCGCGKFETDVITGHWQLEDLQQQKSVEQTDAEFLKAMKVRI